MAESAGPSTSKQLWAKETWMAAIQQIFFAKFMNKKNDDFNAIVYFTDAFKKDKGANFNISLLTPLTGDGVEDDAVLEGNEEALVYYDMAANLKEYVHAVRLKGRLAEQKAAVDMRGDAKAALSDWLAKKIDTLCVTALSASPTTNRVIYGAVNATTNATNDATIVANSIMSTNMISVAKRKAQLATIGGAEAKIRPIKIDGRDMYVALLHPYQAKAIKNSNEWQQAQREANVRDNKNPIFSGALGYWDGVVLFEYERIKTYSNFGTGANLNGARGLFCGAQALAIGVQKYPTWEEKAFDYNRKAGFATGVLMAVAKPNFNSEDYGVIAMDTYIATD
jgi:N4-gp56 family major capsid protein